MMRTVKIGRRSFAAGMRWLTYEEIPPRAELIAEADELGTQYLVRRRYGGIFQIGFGSAEGTALPSQLYSLAAAVAAANAQPWLGLYKLGDDLWWYIAVRDGHAVLPDGDVVGTEAEVHAAQERHASFGDWQFVQGDLSDIEALLAAEGRKLALSRVQPTRRKLPVLPIAAAVASLVLAGGGYWIWHHHQVELAAERAAKMAAFRARLAQARPLASPLVNLPSVNEWMQACDDILTAHPLLFDGWAVAGTTCRDDKVTFIWRREPGGTAARRPPGDLAQSGEAVTETVAMPKLRGGSDDAVGFTKSNDALYGLIQSLGAKGQIAPPREPAGLPGAQQPLPIKAFASEQVTILTPFPPYAVDWASVPGFRVSEVRTSAVGDGAGQGATSIWQITGVIYEH